MADRSIEEAGNPDLQNALAALERAADDARRLALQTGTWLVVFEDGRLRFLDPASAAAEAQATHYGAER